MSIKNLADAAQAALGSGASDGGVMLLLASLAGVGFMLWRRGGRR